MKQGKIWRGLSTVFAVLFAISMVATNTAESRRVFLNQRLGTVNYKLVTVDDGSTGDGIYFRSEFSSLNDLIDAEEKLAVEIAAEGSVLLKNNGALPMSTSETVTLWGLNTKLPVRGGNLGSSAIANEKDGQISYGPREALRAKGFSLNEAMIDLYDSAKTEPYRMSAEIFGNPVFGHSLTPTFWLVPVNADSYNVGEAPASIYSDDVLASADNTAAVVLISRDSSEASDYYPTMVSAVESDSFDRPLALSKNERDMLNLAKAHSTKVVVLINADNPVEIEELKRDEEIDSILWIGEPGINGFLGVADVLSGAVAPSGHLSDTYAVNSVSAPAMVNFGVYGYTNNSYGTGDVTDKNNGDWYLVESEGIYIGYKYYETRYEDQILGQGNATASNGSTDGNAWSYANEISYPFGYGMSYTTFDEKLESVEVDVGGTGRAVISVTNTGSVPAKGVVQLYVQAPYHAGGLEKASVQLLDFGKTAVLQPGATEQVVLEFDPKYMASYDETVVKEDGTNGAWVLEDGDYYFAIGNGVHEALNNILSKKLDSSDKLITITPDETIKPENAIVWNLGHTDVETYSQNVENALQDCDINNLIPGSAEYTTRADWTKGWSPVLGLTATEDMLVGLRNRTYSLTPNGEGLKWGVDHGLRLVDFIILDEQGNFAGVVPLEDELWDQLAEQIPLEDAINVVQNSASLSAPAIGYKEGMINDGPIGFDFGQVAGGYRQNWQPADSKEPTYVGADEAKGGYSMAVMPTEPVVASTFNKELAQREGEIFGEMGLWANITRQMAPGLNLHRSVYCARNHEYYSEDAMLTNLMGVAVCKGGDSKGLQMEPKHLAFNHQERNRVGLSTFFTEQAGRENELRAFQGCLEQNVAAGVMSSFNRNGTVWAGADDGMQIQILRNEWGYKGWILTDMVSFPEFMNWKDGIYGGSSQMLGAASGYAETEWGSMEDNREQILADTAFQQHMRDAVKYTMYQTAKSAQMNGMTQNSRTVYQLTWWQKALIAADIVTGLAAVLFVVLGILTVVKNKKTSK